MSPRATSFHGPQGFALFSPQKKCHCHSITVFLPVAKVSPTSQQISSSACFPKGSFGSSRAPQSDVSEATGITGVSMTSSDAGPSFAPVRVAITRTVYSVPLVRLPIVWLVVVPEATVACRFPGRCIRSPKIHWLLIQELDF